MWSGTKSKMRYSMWKLNAAAACIRGKHILEAQNMLASIDKKGAELIKPLLDSLVNQGVKKGRCFEHMYVKTITCGGRV